MENITSVATVEFGPRDVLILRIESGLTDKQFERFKTGAHDAMKFAEGRIVILEGDVSMVVLKDALQPKTWSAPPAGDE